MKYLGRITFVVAMCALAIAPAQAEKLVLLHTNDTHSQIDPFPEDDLGGIARRKVLIDSVRAENPSTLLIDAGDIVQGTLFFNLYKGELEEKLMNALGYDMRILGNHEFDNGLEALAKNLSVAEAVLLASNYQTRHTPLEGLFLPYSIIDIDGKRIAFLPINLQPAGMISAENYAGMGYVDAVETADKMAWYLKNIEQADKVIAITHVGYDSTSPNDLDVASKTHDIDIIIGGHSHTLIDPADPKSPQHIIKNADGRDVLVAQTGKGGKYLGEIVIDLDNPDAAPTSKLIRVDSRLDSRVDPAIEEIIKPYRQEVDALNSRKITKTANFLDKSSHAMLNYFTDLVADRGRQLADNVDFAILNKGGLRNSLPKGDITEGQIITLMPFFNTINVIDIKGSDLADAFDVMAKAGGNGVSSEVVAEYDPATGKCTKVLINGKPLDPDATYRVATIDYLSNGGDYMTPLTKHTLVARSPNILFEDALAYFRDGKGKGKTINPKEKARMYPLKK